MRIEVRGNGETLVLIPGIQGRWEWMRDAIVALARHYRVVTFSLADEPSADWTFDTEKGLDGYADHVEAVLERLGDPRVVLCGVSFGGLVALRLAARHPARIQALVLVSTPGPAWRLSPRHAAYARWPRLFAPCFAVEAFGRLMRETRRTFSTGLPRWRFMSRYLAIAVSAPGSAPRMAARALTASNRPRLADGTVKAIADDCPRISCPTLVVHGEPELDHVVDVGGTREYLSRLSTASAAVLPRTGHLGIATCPELFADTLRPFIERTLHDRHDSAA